MHARAILLTEYKRDYDRIVAGWHDGWLRQDEEAIEIAAEYLGIPP